MIQFIITCQLFALKLGKKNEPFVQHATFDEELCTVVIDGEFLEYTL